MIFTLRSKLITFHMKVKVMVVFGTRPEAIKMAPVVFQLNKSTLFEPIVVVTAQHRQMLDQVLTFFDLKVDFDLDLMKPGQQLAELTGNVLNRIYEVIKKVSPSVILVHGDTTTSVSSCLAAFYNKIPVGHIEAGLRSENIYSPFPEEMNRRLTSTLSTWHFAPTTRSRFNLIKENIAPSSITVTGNTVLDALFFGLQKVSEQNVPNEIRSIIADNDDSKIILVTGHRRENHGQGLLNICKALRRIAADRKVHIIYPVHMNPKVRIPVYEQLGKIPNITLIEPLDYPSFIVLMSKSYLILTDSGGIQEEAPSLSKPVLVMRENTERPEALEAGTVKLVGTSIERIYNEVTNLIDNDQEYLNMINRNNPYGDGLAANRIVEFLEQNILVADES